jgi:NADPH-dependent 2,4-dienoyl-CoA reductase/sulfur reductase-like enzyme
MLKMRVAGSVAEALALGTRLLEYDLIFAAGDMTGHKLGSAAAAAAAAAATAVTAAAAAAASGSTGVVNSSTAAAAKSSSVSASGESRMSYFKYWHFTAFCWGAGVAAGIARHYHSNN